MTSERADGRTDQGKAGGDWWICALGTLLLLMGIYGLAFGTFGHTVGGVYIVIGGWPAFAGSMAACFFGVWWLSSCIGSPFRHPGPARLLWSGIMVSSVAMYIVFTVLPRFRALMIAYAIAVAMWLLSVWVSRSFKGGRPISAEADGPPVSRGRSGDDEERPR